MEDACASTADNCGPGCSLKLQVSGSCEEVTAARLRFLDSGIAVAMLDAVPDMALVLNESGQIVAANTTFLTTFESSGIIPLLGARLGEAIGCVHSTGSAGSCGTSQACGFCGAGRAISDCLRTKQRSERECQILSVDERQNAFDLLARAVYVPAGGMGLVLVVLRDISSRKRRHVLERVFLHDVLNTVGGIYSLAGILRDSALGTEESTFAKDIHHLAELALDEIRAQHKLMLAESGELELEPATVRISDLLSDIAALYARHDVGTGKHIAVQPMNGALLQTDPVLLRRALGNLLKNALEATPIGGTVSIATQVNDQSVAVSVCNAGVMSDEAQHNVFKLSFSTKASSGRGLGTYSARLFIEGPLAGKIDFDSCPERGTTFTVWIPRHVPVAPARLLGSVSASSDTGAIAVHPAPRLSL